MKTKAQPRPFVRIGSALLCLAAIASGCGGSTSDGGSVTPVPIDDFSARFAAAFCENIGGCCQKLGWTYDAGACKTAFIQFLDTDLVAKAKAAGTTYDADAAGQCLSALAKASAACQPDELPTVCQRIFVGVEPAGSSCESSLECAPAPNGGRATCQGNDPNQGVCVQEPRGKFGDSCGETCNQTGTSTSCSGGSDQGPATCWKNDGVYCSSNTGLCEVLSSMGQPCNEDDSCVNGAYCGNGICTAKLVLGGDCSASYAACADGYYCDPSSKCQKQKEPGVACTEGNECIGYCNDSNVCESQGLLNAAACAGITS